MHLAYVADTEFFEENGKFYCHQMDYNIIGRFLKYFDSITIIGRRRIEANNFLLIDFPNVEVCAYDKFTSPLGFISVYRQIKSHIKNAVKNCDAVYCRNFNGIIAQKFANKYKKPCVTFIGGSYYESMRSMGSLKMTLAAPFAERAYKKSALDSDAVLYCSPHLKKEYPTNGDGYHWCEIILEDNCPQDVREKRLNTDLTVKKEINIALIGQFCNNVKGIDTAIKALSLLDKKYRLFILGEGDTAKWIPLAEKLGVADRLTFCDYISGSDAVFKWLDTMDIYIQPSRTEGIAKAPIEAMSRGIPIITSGQGAMGHYTNKALIHGVEDYSSLAEMIGRLAEDKDFYNEMSRYSFRTAKDYTTSHFDKIFDEMCKKLIGRE